MQSCLKQQKLVAVFFRDKHDASIKIRLTLVYANAGLLGEVDCCSISGGLRQPLQESRYHPYTLQFFFHYCYNFSTIWYIDKDFHNNFFQFQDLTGFSVLLNKTQIWMQRLLNGSILTTCTAFHPDFIMLFTHTTRFMQSINIIILFIYKILFSYYWPLKAFISIIYFLLICKMFEPEFRRVKCRPINNIS